jgi:hypothetical protein
MSFCNVRAQLQADERNAWAAFTVLRDSGSHDEPELERRYKNACNAHASLTFHLANCDECCKA